MNDLKFAFRQLLKNPGFTAAAVLTLALGIGANTAIFSVVNAVLLRPLPFKQADRLVWVWENNLSKNIPLNPVAPGDFTDWRDQSRVFEGLSAWEGDNFNLTDRGEPERVLGAKVFGDFFEVLGVQPILGRTFLPEEDRVGGHPVALLSHGLWQRRFGGATNVLGAPVTVDGKNFTVIGVMPALGGVPFNLFEIWMPFALDNRRMAAHGDRFLRPLGRLKPGVTVQRAQAELGGIARRLERLYPRENTGVGVLVIPLKEMFTGELRAPLLVLLGAVGFVLLIACANVANLMLARATAREKEVTLRAALGATRFRLARQLFTETLLLCALGAAVGLGLAGYGIQFSRALVPAVSASYKVPVPGLDEIGIDTWVLAFTVGVSFLTALLCGLAPALKSSRLELTQALKEGAGASVTAFRGERFRSLLVVSEVSLAFVLLVVAGLMMQSFWRLAEVRLGFDPHNVLCMSMSLPESRYPAEPQRIEFYRQLVQQVETLPGVKSAAVANYLPLSGHWETAGFSIEGRPPLAPGDFLTAHACTVSPGYFRTMGIPLLDGRSFSTADRPNTARVVIINQTMARSFWPQENPIGRRLNFGDADKPDWWEIIGVAGDVRHFGPAAAPRRQVYFAHTQAPGKWMSLVVRTVADPLKLVTAVRAQVQTTDPAQPVYDIQTFEKLLSQTIAPRRFAMLILGTFAAVALLLGAIGIYGVIAYAVSRRTHEIGVRMALGARRRDVLRLVVGQGIKPTLIGVGVGLAGSLVVTRMLRSLLFEVKPFDPLTYLLMTLTLTFVALLACWLPARRAAKIEPMEALRCE